MFSSLIMGFGSSAIVAFFGAFMVRIVHNNHAAVVDALLGLMDRAGHKVGVSDDTLKTYHDQLLKTVAWVDSYTGDPKFWRQVARTIMAMTDPAKRAQALQQFNFSSAEQFLADNLPAELKAVVNETKTQLAVQAVSAHASIALPPQFMASRVITQDVKDAVKVAKVADVQPDVTKEQLENLLADHLKMKQEWLNHGK